MQNRNDKNNKHEFAFFCRELPVSLLVNSNYTITDQDLVHRMTHVVRIAIGDTVQLFRDLLVVNAQVTGLTSKGVSCIITGLQQTRPLSPIINWYVPLLDREAFEESIYILTSMGAAQITPVITEKSDKRLTRPMDRLERIMIAAAEQSKQLVLPIINPVRHLAEIFFADYTLFFDPDGQSAFEILETIRTKKPAVISCLIGPEGDLSQAEKELLRDKNIVFCALTPTILRAEQAVTVAMGLLRSAGMPVS